MAAAGSSELFLPSAGLVLHLLLPPLLRLLLLVLLLLLLLLLPAVWMLPPLLHLLLLVLLLPAKPDADLSVKLPLVGSS